MSPRNRRGILIDPSVRQVREVEVPANSHDDWRAIANLLDAGYLARSPLTQERKDALWFDEEGGGREEHPYGYFRMQGIEFAGRGLVLGMDRKDNVIDTTLSAAEVEQMVQFGRAESRTADNAWLDGPWLTHYREDEDGTPVFWRLEMKLEQEASREEAQDVAT